MENAIFEQFLINLHHHKRKLLKTGAKADDVEKDIFLTKNQ